MPGLDPGSLAQDIAKRRLRPVYLLVGEDVKLIDRTVDAIEATVDPADRPFAVEHLYAGEEGGTPIDVVTSARILPMLGDRRIVVVLRAERFLKPKRAAKAAATDDEVSEKGSDEPVDVVPLEEYLEAPVTSSSVVFVATEIDRTRRFTKRLLEKAAVVEFGGLPPDSGSFRRDARPGTPAWLQAELAQASRTIEPDAARMLMARAGQDITKLRGDVERLLLFTEGRRRISIDDVMEVVAEDHGAGDEWGVVNAIAAGNTARALAEIGRRLDHGDSPHALVGQLRWWVSTRLSEGDPSRVKAALDALLRTDLALKSSGGEDRVLLERLVVELTGRPLAQRSWR